MFAQALSDALFTKRNSTSSLGGLFSFGASASGVISTDNALKLSALYNGVTIIANDIAILPKSVYFRDGDTKSKQPAHPVNYKISKQPNDNLTSFHFHKVMVITAILRGNAVAIIKRDGNGKLDKNALNFVHPDDLQDIKLIDGQLWFYTKFGVFHNSEVIHIKGFSTNGYTGQSVLKYAASNLNAALTAEAFAETNFESKGFGLGVIKTDKSLTADAKRNLNEGMESRLSQGGQFNIGTLDEGMDFMPINVSAKEAELINWKKITILDVCRWLNIGPHKLKQLDNTTYSSIEQQSIDHLQDSILPWVTQFENEYDTKLFTQTEATKYYIKFNINALLRVDIKSRAEYFYKMRYAGVYSGDEIRVLEDMNPTGLEHMAVPLQPVQIQQQSQINTEDGKD